MQFQTILTWLIKPFRFKTYKKLWYWFLYRTFRRYNIVKISSLPPGYYDIDERLMHSMFDLLVEFVEKEKPFDALDWDGSGEAHAFAAQEIRELYHWWKEIYPTRESPLNNLPYDLLPPRLKIDHRGPVSLIDSHDDEYPSYQLAVSETWRLEQEWADEDTKNLVRLINIRNFLWT